MAHCHWAGESQESPMFFADNDSTAADSEAMIDQNRLKIEASQDLNDTPDESFGSGNYIESKLLQLVHA